MIYFLGLLILFFFVTLFLFLNDRKKLIDSIGISIENYLDKYKIPADGVITVESLNMTSTNDNFSNKKLFVWNDGTFLNMINTDFEDDLGIVSIELSKIHELKLHEYPYSSKKDVFLTFKVTSDDTPETSYSSIYFNGDSYEDFKSVIHI